MLHLGAAAFLRACGYDLPMLCISSFLPIHYKFKPDSSGCMLPSGIFISEENRHKKRETCAHGPAQQALLSLPPSRTAQTSCKKPSALELTVGSYRDHRNRRRRLHLMRRRWQPQGSAMTSSPVYPVQRKHIFSECNQPLLLHCAQFMGQGTSVHA